MKYYNIRAYEYWILKYPESAKRWGFKQGYSWGFFFDIRWFFQVVFTRKPNGIPNRIDPILYE